MSQKQQILEHLKEGRSITPLGALNVYGCFRLSARIYELRQEGYDIKTETITKKGRVRDKEYAKYILEG